ncbi:MAG: RNase adapter RapZ [Lachnospiraceae bacterium]|nr:RNase adapter RapZ [Lachnospiraceae bacterium]
MRFVIVSGMSGAGKSTALKMLEDAGYFCVDNLPIQLICPFAKMAFDGDTKLERAAIGVDIRSGNDLDKLESMLEDMQKSGYEYELLYLDASDEVLIRRYKETRRRHPLAKNARIESGILLEREKTSFLKRGATYVLDTSTMLTRELKAELDKIFVEEKPYRNIYITVLSFGFKYGIPADSDLVFDVRFLPNPYYVPELKYLTGNDEPIREFVMKNEEATEFLMKLIDMMEFLIPNYQREGKYQLVISIGCTGGKHRSVTLANALFGVLRELGYSVKIEHRDIEKDARVKGEPGK